MTIDNRIHNKIIKSNNGIKNNNTLENGKQHEMAKKLDNNNNMSCVQVCAITSLLIFGFLFFSIGMLTFKYCLFDVVMQERIEMLPIYPSYFWWLNPKPEVLLNVYIFNITNSAEFIKGTDKVLKLQEVGPIVYQEKLLHKDIEFHKENSTMSYTVVRTLVFRKEKNIPGILNETIISVNMATLGAAASLTDSNYFVKSGFNFLMMSQASSPVINTTIYNYFWNLTDPVLNLAKSFVPWMVPTKDTGLLQNIYKNYTDRVNVLIGKAHGNENFFKIQTYNERATVPGFNPEQGDCFASLVNSTEGALYPQFIKKETVLWYWRKTLCRTVPLYYEKEVKLGSIVGYKFVLKDDTFDRLKNASEDCFKGNTVLPSGLSDLSRCFFGQPLAASSPHFYNRKGPWISKLQGLAPNAEKHESYFIAEPTMGVPINQAARSQSNLVVGDVSSFKSDIATFSNMVIPMMWLDIYQKELTPLIIGTVEFIVNILPKIQYIISSGFVLIGLLLVFIGFKKKKNSTKISKVDKKIDSTK
ncbi:unnamed protein product [Diamesa serratosioi]